MKCPTLILFVRIPRLGVGKRRLAREIGDVAALRFERLMLARRLRLLGRHDVVFGPARDGGFWLVGCRHRAPDFGRVRWSSRHALPDAVANLPRSVSVGFAVMLDDVDDGEAYRRAICGHA